MQESNKARRPLRSRQEETKTLLQKMPQRANESRGYERFKSQSVCLTGIRPKA